MNICVTVNSKYEKYLYVMLVSLYEVHDRGDISLYVIQRDFTENDKADIQDLTEEYGNDVTYIYADPNKFDNMPKSDKGRNNLTLEIYFRLLIPEYLPKTIDRVLMLDVDIVVLRDLHELYEIDFAGKYLAAAPNMCHNGQIPDGWLDWYGKGRTNLTHYNTGILMWNLEAIRRDYPSEYIFKQAWKHPIDVATFEEELFNVVFGENDIREIPAEKYNYICTHEDMFEFPRFTSYGSNDELRKNCSIVHYAALNPWQAGKKNDKFLIWWDICKKTKYYQSILEESYCLSEKYIIQQEHDLRDDYENRITELNDNLSIESKKLYYVDVLLDEKYRSRVVERLRKLSCNKVVVYGAGRVARCLDNLFAGTEIDILCYIDKNYHGAFLGKRCVGLSDIDVYMREADCIIISNPYYIDKIIEDLKVNTDKMTLSIDELIDERDPFWELEEYRDILADKHFFIVGNGIDYDHVLRVLANYGLEVAGIVSVDDITGKDANHCFVIVDLDHLDIERRLIEKGFVFNKDFITLTDLFVCGYEYSHSAPLSFDKGTGSKEKWKGYFCPLPFTQLYYYEYMADICSPTWNNDVNVGNPQELSIEQIWNSPKAQEVRRSVLDGSFDFCNDEICWRMIEGKLFKRDEITDPKLVDIIENNRTIIEGGPEFINIAYNSTCNLNCRMCRKDVISSVDSFHKKKAIDDLKAYNFANLKRLIIPGSGELFANDDYVELLQNIDNYNFPNLEAVWIYSNGVLFTEENWEKVNHLARKYKLKIFISTDSVCRETFMKIRRGGDYNKFISNLEMLGSKRRNNEFDSLYLAFCVQRLNFREMPEFVLFAEKYGADCVHYEKLFHSPISECVHRRENVYYDEFVDSLKETVALCELKGISIDIKPFSDVLSV